MLMTVVNQNVKVFVLSDQLRAPQSIDEKAFYFRTSQQFFEFTTNTGANQAVQKYSLGIYPQILFKREVVDAILSNAIRHQFNWMDYKPFVKNEYREENWLHPQELADPYELLYNRYVPAQLQYGLQPPPPSHYIYDPHFYLRPMPFYDPIAEKEMLLTYYKLSDPMRPHLTMAAPEPKYIEPCSQQEFFEVGKCHSRDGSNMYMAAPHLYEDNVHSRDDYANNVSDQDCQLIKAEDVPEPRLECWIAPESKEEVAVVPEPKKPAALPILPKPNIGGLTPEERQAKIDLYRQKRKRRIYTKKVAYDCRKKVADQRIRIKGRFVTKHQALQELHIDDEDFPIDRIKELLSQQYVRAPAKHHRTT